MCFVLICIWEISILIWFSLVSSLQQVFLKVFNKPLCMTAITVLSVTYLAGSVAGIVQLWRGTKYSRFPRWLNSWMTSRRQLGLIALYMVLTHALMSAMMLSPTYYSSWFQKSSLIVPANLTGQVNECSKCCVLHNSFLCTRIIIMHLSSNCHNSLFIHLYVEFNQVHFHNLLV